VYFLTGLYYDGNSGVWYTYDQETQQYTAYVAPESSLANGAIATADASTASNLTSTTKAKVISAPPVVTVDPNAEPKKQSLAEAVAAAAEAAKLSAKKEKERMKEKQRQHEGVVPATPAEEIRVTNPDTVMDVNANLASGRGAAVQAVARAAQPISTPNKIGSGRGMSTLGRGGGNPFSGNYQPPEGSGRARPLTQSSGRGVSVFGNTNSLVQQSSTVGRGAGRGRGAETSGASLGGGVQESPVVVTPFKTDASALGAFPNSTPSSTGRRRFTEAPQSGYRDRAAERRNLYSTSLPGDMSEADGKEKGTYNS
jgi:RNA-binding protein 5/10